MVEDLVKAKIVFDTSSITGTASSVSGSGGLAGKNGLKDIGKIAAGVSAGLAVFKGIEFGMKKLVEASPRLQKTITIFNKSLTLILRPIADLMNIFLRPLALSLLRYAVPFYRNSLKNLNTAGGKVGGALGLVGGALGGAAAGATAGGALGLAGGPAAALTATAGALGGGIGGLLGINVGKKLQDWTKSIIDWFKSIEWENLFKNVKDFFVNFGTSIYDFFTSTIPSAVDEFKTLLSNFFLNDLPFAAGYAFESVLIFFKETLPNTITSAFNTIKDFIIVTIPNAFNKSWSSVKTFLTVTLPFSIKEAWNAIKTFFTETVPSWITQSWEGVKTFFTETVPSWIQTMVDSVKGIVNAVVSSFSIGRFTRKSVNDAIITPQGQVIETHPDDYLIATKTPGVMSSGSTTKINININALDPSSINSSVLSKIISAVEDGIKRGMLNKTTEVYGI